jgi:DNA-binding transcriptional regulator of glucitol operon
MHIELQVPPDNSNLSDCIEDYFNTSALVGRFCENGCQSFVQSEKRSRVSRNAETEFLVFILTRAIETMDGFQLNKSKVTATNDVFIRYIR